MLPSQYSSTMHSPSEMRSGMNSGVRGESTEGRVASAAGPDAHCTSARTTREQSTLRVARRRPAGDVDVHRRGPPTTPRTADCRLWRQRRPGQMGPRPGRGRAGGAVPRSRFRRNPKGAWVLLGSALVRLAKVARPRMRAIAALLLLDDPHRDRLRRRALRSPHFHSPNWKFARSGTLRVNTHARDPLYFHHGLLVLTGGSLRVLR